MPTNDEETKQEVQNKPYPGPKDERTQDYANPPIIIKGGSVTVESKELLTYSAPGDQDRPHHYKTTKITVNQIEVYDTTVPGPSTLVGLLKLPDEWEVRFYFSVSA